MRIGIFGGTFNPIHFGHLRTVEEIREIFKLEIIYYVLSKIPPHKANENLVLPKDRYEILKLAVKKNRFFKASPVELRRKKPSYSIDTINYFIKKFTNDNLFFIMGSDAFYEIDLWHKYKNIISSIDIIVMKREDFKINKSYLNKLGYKENKDFWENDFNKKVYFSSVSRLDISSSKIREFLKKNISVNYLLPEKCINYINKKNFYKGNKND